MPPRVIGTRLTEGEEKFLDTLGCKSKSAALHRCVEIAMDLQAGPDMETLAGSWDPPETERRVPAPPPSVTTTPTPTILASPMTGHPLSRPPAAERPLEARGTCPHPVGRRIGTMCGRCGKVVG